MKNSILGIIIYIFRRGSFMNENQFAAIISTAKQGYISMVY